MGTTTLKLLVDNLPVGTRGSELRDLFANFGQVTDVVMFDCSENQRACALLSVSGGRLSAHEVAERLGRMVWKGRRLDVYEPRGLPEFPAMRAVA